MFNNYFDFDVFIGFLFENYVNILFSLFDSSRC